MAEESEVVTPDNSEEAEEDTQTSDLEETEDTPETSIEDDANIFANLDNIANDEESDESPITDSSELLTIMDFEVASAEDDLISLDNVVPPADATDDSTDSVASEESEVASQPEEVTYDSSDSSIAITVDDQIDTLG